MVDGLPLMLARCSSGWLTIRGVCKNFTLVTACTYLPMSRKVPSMNQNFPVRYINPVQHYLSFIQNSADSTPGGRPSPYSYSSPSRQSFRQYHQGAYLPYQRPVSQGHYGQQRSFPSEGYDGRRQSFHSGSGLNDDAVLFAKKMKRPFHDKFDQSPKRPRHASPRFAGTPVQQTVDVPEPIMPVNPDASVTDHRNRQLSEQIWRYFHVNRQSDADFQRKMELRNAVFEIVQGIIPYAGLYIVGSSMTGFATHTSDMDMCLMVSPTEIRKEEAIKILRKLRNSLHHCRFVSSPFVINAKCPILKFVDSFSNIEVDLNVNNSVGIRNTHLLKYYANSDWRLRPLMLIAKAWARAHDINDASRSTISSYSLCMMMIHYLQYGCNPPVLGCLQKSHPNLFSGNIPISGLKMDGQVDYKSDNVDSLGTLFLGFLEYYSKAFDYASDVGSIRTGTKIPWKTIKLGKGGSNINSWKCLKLEEPFDGSNTARSVYNFETFEHVKHVIRWSYNELARKRDLCSVVPNLILHTA